MGRFLRVLLEMVGVALGVALLVAGILGAAIFALFQMFGG